MRKVFLLVLVLLMVLPASAQISNDDEVPLVPFYSLPLDVQGVRPESWLAQQGAEGVFLRAGDPLDSTAIIMQAQEVELASFLADLPTLLQLSEDLTLVDLVESDFLSWELYTSARMNGEQELLVDLGVAQDEATGRVYYVLMQTNAVFYENLHEQVFLRAIDWMAPIQTYEDKEETYSVPVPVLWEAVDVDKDFGQLTNEDDTVAIFVDSIESDDPIAASQEFLTLINEDFEFDNDPFSVNVLEEESSIGELESVTIVNWLDVDASDGFVVQTVARLYEGVVYITAIVSDVDAILENEESVALIDNGFMVSSLDTDEADVEESEEETDE